ncbi:MAG: DUF2935 domain-containing protein [Clostridiaceae bacterium]|nr:DUF2935 domain-containing protein [Clostridiaceae bacterium]
MKEFNDTKEKPDNQDNYIPVDDIESSGFQVNNVVLTNVCKDPDSPGCKECLCQYNRLEEARFWSRIMEEHALFILLGLPCDQSKHREKAKFFINLFSGLRKRLDEACKLEGDLLRDLIEAVKAIIEFKAELLRHNIECRKAPGSNYPLLLDHIRREAERFLSLLQKPVPQDSLELLLEQEAFWLRIMKEHIEFVIHLLDPSERELIEQAEAFRKTFSRLLETARDLLSMNEVRPKNFNTVIRFTQDVVRNTTQLRDFKAAAFELTILCELLSIVSTPLLLDHIRREADKFLSELEVLLPEVIKCHSTLQ